MRRILPNPVKARQPFSVKSRAYRAEMALDLKQIVRDNVVALLRHKTGEEAPGVSRLIALGFSNGNAQRLLGGETSIGANLLQQVAEVFELQPWQLLVPGLDPAELPGLTADSTAWPFPLVDRHAYQSLSAVERAYVQGVLANAIADRIGKRLRA